MRCGVLAIDPDARLVLLNDVALQLLDLAARPAPGSSIDDALAEYPQIGELLRDSFAMTSPPNRAELEIRRGSTDPKTIGFTVSAVTGPAGERLGAAMFFKDLTQIEHTEEQARLHDRLAALGEMTANLAHEIRNPLASIGVTCALLGRQLESGGEGSRRAVELLGKISAEIARLDRTVTSSLEFVRPVGLELESAALA
jgi:two-component system sensor histidine kinase PilS (NtrC family)